MKNNIVEAAQMAENNYNAPTNTDATPDVRTREEAVRKRAEVEMAMFEQTKQKKEALSKQKPKIGAEEIRKATEILRKYKEGKARLEEKIIANEEFWKLRQWNYYDTNADFRPATAWLWNCIQSRYSDAMDAYPTCVFRPRQEDDKSEALKLSEIVPVILEQNRYEDTYSDIVWYALKHGGCVQGVFWDGSAHNGLGDVKIKKIDILSLYWQPGVTDIQDSQHVFTTELVDNNILEQMYPQTVGNLGGKSINVARFLYDDSIDTSEKSVVIDWYYHTHYGGKKVLQYVKFVNEIVLFATENEVVGAEEVSIDPITKIPITVQTKKPMAETGLYDHAKYPFVTMPLFPIEGSICGYGLTDIGKDTQLQIDLLNKAIIDNSLDGASPRFFVRDDGTVNLTEYSDKDKKFVKVEGSIGDEFIRPIETKPLGGIYVSFLQQKIEELKHVTSNQDVNNGATPSGVTSGTAIASLQESAGKNSRSMNKAFYRAYREVCYQVLELVRQFYDLPRTFRITNNGEEMFVTYNNTGLKPQKMQTMGIETGLRLPEFDIKISAEKNNPYKRMEMNELGMLFYNAGFFNVQMSDQAIAALSIMDFDGKDEVVRKISENGTLYETLLLYQQMALQLANKYEPALAEQIAVQIMAQGGQPIPQGNSDISILTSEKEHPQSERARQTARESTQV